MYEDLLFYGGVLAVIVGLVYSWLGVKVSSFAVVVEKYPTGSFLKVKEDADGCKSRLHGTKVAWVKDYEPIVLHWGRRFIRLFLVKHKNNKTLSWEQVDLELRVKDVPNTKTDEVEIPLYADKKIFEGLKTGKASLKAWLMSFIPGVCVGAGGVAIFLEATHLLGWL